MDSRLRRAVQTVYEKRIPQRIDDGWFVPNPAGPAQVPATEFLLGCARDSAIGWQSRRGRLRVATIIAFIATGFWPVGALYLAAALIMKPASR